MQNTITITELLRSHKNVQKIVEQATEPMAVISNSKIIFYIQSQKQNANKANSKMHTRTRFEGKIEGKIGREEIYNKSWLDQ
jgi:hypothetical protein